MESHLQALIAYFSGHPSLAVGAVFAAALLEALAVVGGVIPGSSIVFVGGVLVGLKALDPWWTVTAAVSGAILGDGISYWLGRHHHERIRSMWPLRTHPEVFERGQAYFAKNGGKSVFLGRFLGPIRAIVPVVAGMSHMPARQFYVVNVLSAFAWAAVHIFPGVLFGASLQLAGAVSSRLVILLVLVAAIVWALGWLVRRAHGRAWPFAKRQRDRMVRWAQAKSGPLPHVVLSLFDPARPESPALLTAAVLLLAGAWVFLGVLQDIVSNDPLMQVDHAVFAALGTWRVGWADDVMVAATELGSAGVAVPVIAAVSVLLALKRCWRTLAYWLTAVGFAQLLVWTLKMALRRARPTELYTGFEQFAFPSGHVASTIVVYGFLAFLLARGKPANMRMSVSLLAALAILLVSLSRLYLGVHWLSDVLGSLSLGTAWVALLSMAYTQHVRNERLPARALSLTALGTFAVVGTLYVSAHHKEDVAWYAPRSSTSPALLANWQTEGWQQLPAARTEIGGDAEEPLSVQWAASSDQIAAALATGAWRTPAPWASSAALLWLLPSTSIGQLPVLPKYHGGEPQRLEFEKVLDDTRRLVIRLWATSYVVDAGTGQRRPLWSGMVSIERLERPGNLITLANTSKDFDTPVKLLAQTVGGQQLPMVIRLRGDLPVLLVWTATSVHVAARVADFDSTPGGASLHLLLVDEGNRPPAHFSLSAATSTFVGTIALGNARPNELL